MEGTLLASNLGFPKPRRYVLTAPSSSATGTSVSCSGGTPTRWGRSRGPAARRGAPCSASDGAVYVTQGGNVPAAPDQRAVAGHPAGTCRRGRWRRSRPRSTAMRLPAPTTSRSAPTVGCGSPTRAPRPQSVPRGRSAPGRLSALGSGAAGRVPDGVDPTSTPTASRRRAGPAPYRVRGAPGLPAGRRPGDDLLPALRRPRARRDGVRRRRPGRSSARRSPAASPRFGPTARCWRRSRSASTRRTASSTARRGTRPRRRSPRSTPTSARARSGRRDRRHRGRCRACPAEL